jgi:S1-C subfamily serine protease
VIVAVGGRRVGSTEELRDALARHKPGQTVNVQIHRGTTIAILPVTLGRQPSTPQG